MSLTKITSVDLIEVVENGCIQVRTKTAVKEDGVEISSKFHRHVVVPGEKIGAGQGAAACGRRSGASFRFSHLMMDDDKSLSRFLSLARTDDASLEGSARESYLESESLPCVLIRSRYVPA